ncbi:MAG: hypothetical protein HYY96_02930 [Candidatus Tectomicrobia bacterium]|nr:hypothetical protein [Candidatus Tectomicrobia bacterium]
MLFNAREFFRRPRGRLLPRVLELTYTAWDLAPFAKDCGYDGPPFRWDEERRFLLRYELDAAFFHLYLGSGKWRGASGETEEELAALQARCPTPRDAAAYILDTFPIVKRKDEQRFGEYRAKRLILEVYDAMQRATTTGQPYQTLLDPRPRTQDARMGRSKDEMAVAMDTTDIRRLVELADYSRQEAIGCLRSEAYFAGCLVVGTALEAALLALVIWHPQDVHKATSTPRHKNGTLRPYTQWSLSHLVEVADELNWIPKDLSKWLPEGEQKKMQVDDHTLDHLMPGFQCIDFLHLLIRVRNLVHPYRYLKENMSVPVPEDVCRCCLFILDDILRHLTPST